MENAVEALKQAAAVLIFVIALTASFNMFSKAKETADAVTTSQDSQEYLESAKVENTLYISSGAIATESNGKSSVEGMTTKGDRIVKANDVISTIYRYNLEKYGVTIVKSDGTVIARFDSNTESVIRQWYNITSGKESDGTEINGEAVKANFADKLKENLELSTDKYVSNINLNKEKLEEIYKISVNGNTNITVGAPWYGSEKEIIKRINSDISGEEYELNNQRYQGKNLNDYLQRADTIIEVINEIDNSDYLKDGSGADTSLLQQYELPTVEIVYIIK